jgi:hypothetical protein
MMISAINTDVKFAKVFSGVARAGCGRPVDVIEGGTVESLETLVSLTVYKKR